MTTNPHPTGCQGTNESEASLLLGLSHADVEKSMLESVFSSPEASPDRSLSSPDPALSSTKLDQSELYHVVDVILPNMYGWQ